jgi:hypothetical protein
MILPASYQSGFAPRDGHPLYPSLWRGCVFAAAPCLGASGSVLRDWSGRQNHGTLTNMDPGTDWVASGGRWALDFDGTNDYVEAPSQQMTGIIDVTVSLWIYPRVTSGTQWIIGRYANTTDFNGWYLYGNPASGFFFDGRESVSAYLSSGGSGAYTANSRWFHVCGVKRANRWSIWVDGIEKNAATVGNGTTTFADNVFRFGGVYVLTTSYYGDEQLDDIRVYNRALSPQEVRLLASRRGIAYELDQRIRYVDQGGGFSAAWARRQQLIIGGGVQ